MSKGFLGRHGHSVKNLFWKRAPRFPGYPAQGGCSLPARPMFIKRVAALFSRDRQGEREALPAALRQREAAFPALEKSRDGKYFSDNG